ncbi:hypothetical protein [Streptomyces sp. NBC_01716]|uniref:hypothetical protein n=1 Tax=Streptomyces sp. NBC_01716 TaxID=2975917 RepID=UPI002E35A9AE|nr:hypothetical protein [Streptomyces sp. NBC_01716]
MRAALFAAVGVLLAALGHVLMSGMTVPWPAVLVACAITGLTGWVVTGRERGFPVVLSSVVAVQALLHAWFALAQVTRRPAGTGGGSIMEQWVRHVLCQAPAATMADHTHQAMPGMPAMPDTMAMGSGQSATTSLAMLSAHLLAAVLCGLWLAFGERAAFQCLRACAGWVVAPLRLPGALPAPSVLPRVRADSPHTVRGSRQLLLADAITSRGPPTGTAVL